MRKVWTVLGWVVFGVACVLFVVGLCTHCVDWVDGEMSSELHLAKILADGRGFIITDQWVYSSELRFIYVQLIFTPLFWLFNNWLAVRIVGTMILNIILLLSFYGLLRAISQDLAKLFPWLGALVICPCSFEFSKFINYGTYYIPNLTMAMVILSLIFLFLRATTKKQKIWLLVGSAIISCLGCINGIRQLAVLNFPLVLTAGIYWLINLRAEDKTMVWKFLLITVINLGASIVGFLINVLLSNWLHMVVLPYGAVCWNEFKFENLSKVVNDCLAVFGFQSAVNISAGVLPNITAILILVTYIVSTIYIIKNHQKYSLQELLLTVFTVVGFGVLILINLFTYMEVMEYQIRYYLPVLFFALPVCAIFLRQNQTLTITIKRISINVLQTCGMVLLVLVLLAGVINSTQKHLTVYEYNREVRTATQKLLADGYQCGYAEFWLFPLVVEFSNQEIEMRNINQTDWLQDVKLIQTVPTGEVFLLSNKYIVLGDTGYLYFGGEHICVYIFPSASDLFDALSILQSA